MGTACLGTRSTTEVARIIGVKRTTPRQRRAYDEGHFANKLTEKQSLQISRLASMPGNEIDTSDIPEVLDWSGATRGLLYWPTEQHKRRVSQRQLPVSRDQTKPLLG